MPKGRLNSHDVVMRAAELADEVGFQKLTMALLAQRLGIRAPSLYKHVAGPADLRHRIAILAMNEMSDALREAMQDRSGLDALAALLATVQAYVTAHPGRYAATAGASFTGSDDPLIEASAGALGAVSTALRGYGIGDPGMVHAIRAIGCISHGFASLQAAGGFQCRAEAHESFDWMIRFIDRALRFRPTAYCPTAYCPTAY
jgi:AcrR family transcriptional regulator